MAINDELGKRMKEYYETIPQLYLTRRIPVAIRIDGRAFHTFTKKFNKPFDNILMECMQETMKYLCENIQGCVFGYTQSDEITLILIDYQTLETSAFFNYNVQKVCSIVSSMATLKFNMIFSNKVLELYEESHWLSPYSSEYLETLRVAADKGAMFDTRCFNIPKEEVANLILWRQLDAMRNSIQMCGYYYFSQKELQGLSCKKIKEKLLYEKKFNWDRLEEYKKLGSSCIKIVTSKVMVDMNSQQKETIYMSTWIVDKEMPILKGKDREYVEKYIFI